jgi:hypothetical protein
MNAVLISLFIVIAWFSTLTVQQECGRNTCTENQCCVVRGRKRSCEDLKSVGKDCQLSDVAGPGPGITYRLGCPCNPGLICKRTSMLRKSERVVIHIFTDHRFILGLRLGGGVGKPNPKKRGESEIRLCK